MTSTNEHADRRQRANHDTPLTLVSPVTTSELFKLKPSHHPLSPLHASLIFFIEGAKPRNAAEDNWGATARSVWAQQVFLPKPFQRSSSNQEKRAVAQLVTVTSRQTSMRCGRKEHRGSNSKEIFGFTLGPAEPKPLEHFLTLCTPETSHHFSCLAG